MSRAEVLRRFHGCISEEDSKLLDEIDAELDSIEMVEMKEDLDRLECALIANKWERHKIRIARAELAELIKKNRT